MGEAQGGAEERAPRDDWDDVLPARPFHPRLCAGGQLLNHAASLRAFCGCTHRGRSGIFRARIYFRARPFVMHSSPALRAPCKARYTALAGPHSRAVGACAYLVLRSVVGSEIRIKRKMR